MSHPVADALRAEGGLLAAELRDAPPPEALADGLREDRAAALSAVREAWRLHGGEAPLVLRGEDRDLALLAGDRLYALGLERLARAGDVAAVEVLAQTIADCARAAAEARPERARAAWAAAVRNLAP